VLFPKMLDRVLFPKMLDRVLFPKMGPYLVDAMQ